MIQMRKMVKKYFAIIFSGILLTVGLAGCSAQTTSDTAETVQADRPEDDQTDITENAEADITETVASNDSETVTSNDSETVYVDDCQREVTVPAKIQRIVPSGPLSQIFLFALAPDMFVALASKWIDEATPFIDETYLSLPYLGQLYGEANLNVEELALLAPDIIIDVGQAKGSVVEDMDYLQEVTTIPSVHIDATLETMPDAFRKLGELLHREEKAEELAAFCEKTYQRTEKIMEQVGDEKVRTLYILGADGAHVLAKDSYQSGIIDLMTDNVAVMDNPSGKGTGDAVSIEQIMAWNPDFVIFAPDSIYEDVASTPVWKEMPAIAAGNYVKVPNGPHNWMGSPPAVQRYLGLIWLPSVLYPQYCDYDVIDEVKQFYRLFYGCELTDAQYEQLVANSFPH